MQSIVYLYGSIKGAKIVLLLILQLVVGNYLIRYERESAYILILCNKNISIFI